MAKLEKQPVSTSKPGTNTGGMSPGTKKLIIILVAIAVGLVAAFSGFKYMQHQRYVSEQRQLIESYLTEKAFDKLSYELRLMVATGSLTKCYPDTSAFIDMLLEHCEVYVVQPGLGGYYDGETEWSSSTSKGLGVEGMESIGTKTTDTYTGYCGDFQAGSIYVTNRYDGLLDDKSKSKYNTTRGFNEIYCRGEEVYGKITAYDLKEAVADGAQYMLCGRHIYPKEQMDSLILISEDKIYALKNATASGFDAIEGDFSKELEKVAAAYHPD